MFVLDVILDTKARTLDRVFSYACTPEEYEKAQLGSRVLVPFGKGNSLKIGVVVDYGERLPTIELKKIIKLADEKSLIPDDLILLSRFLRKEYGAKRIDIAKLILPPSFSDVEKLLFIKGEIPKKETSESLITILNQNIGKTLSLSKLENEFGEEIKKLIVDFTDCLSIETRLKLKKNRPQNLMAALDKEVQIKPNATKQASVLEILRKGSLPLETLLKEAKVSMEIIHALEKKQAIILYNRPVEEYPRPKLTDEQEKVLLEILSSGSKNFLLKGVTGSGKTEIYLRLAETFLKRERAVICLVPEISLTPQMTDRFRGRFGEKVAIIHSKLTVSERETHWRNIKNGQAKIVVGARSSIFAPVKDLGLIIVDEEHESSFKSQSGVRYETARVAEERVKFTNSTLVLGSATPDIRSYYRAKKNELKLLELKKRISGETLDVELVDMRKELKNGNPSIISMSLYEKMTKALLKDEQIILFLNRKGYSANLTCRNCGTTIKCENCDVSLGYYKSKDRLKCSYCGTLKSIPKTCPNCSSPRIGYFGLGTELVEEVVKKLFPFSKVRRMDFETTRERTSYEEIYRSMLNEETDILIGTQMVSKGLDFPKVSLVGVLLADISLNFPDFQSQEKTFQLITQVSGRAGRAETEGNVVIQTYQPEHFAISLASEGNYERFVRNELSIRREFFYPPFSRMLLVGFKGKNREEVKMVAEDFAVRVEKNAKGFQGKIFGPMPSFIEWIKQKFRFQILYKTLPEKFQIIREAVFEVYHSYEGKYAVDIIIDVDPISVI